MRKDAAVDDGGVVDVDIEPSATGLSRATLRRRQEVQETFRRYFPGINGIRRENPTQPQTPHLLRSHPTHQTSRRLIGNSDCFTIRQAAQQTTTHATRQCGA